MAMNSAPSSRYRTASDPITPISDSALEIGCVCTTTFTAQTTAIAAKARNRITSIASFSRKQRHHQSGGEQVNNSDRKQEFPGEAHQLVISEARQRSADPDEDEQQEAGLGDEPEQRHENRRHRRNQHRGGESEEYNSKYGKRKAVRAPRRIQP